MNPTRFAAGHAAHADWRVALARALDALLLDLRAAGGHDHAGRDGLPEYTLGFCYLSDRFAADVRDAGTEAPGGLVLNLELAEPEGEKGRGRPAWNDARGVEDAAHDLVAGVRDAWDGEVWVTTHGKAVAEQPWSALRDLDGVLPQAYNPGCTYKSGFVARCVRSYAEGPMRGKPVVPLLGANSTLAGCMRRYVEEATTLDPRPDALGWWSWAGLESSASKRAEVGACALSRL